MNIVLRGYNNYDVKAVSDDNVLLCLDPSLTVQDGADECDINFIVKKFGITGELPVGLVAPTFGDFVGINDYQSALHAISEADKAFMEMPADVRSRFDNDPQKFVAFCSDEANASEMASLGLLDAAAVSRLAVEAEAKAAADKDVKSASVPLPGAAQSST